MSQKIAACEQCESFIVGFTSGESCPNCGTSLVSYEAIPATELAALRAESESRRVALEQKAKELRREWTRAENAEAALEEAKAVIAHARKQMAGCIENDNHDYDDADTWLRKYGGLK